MKSRTSSPDEPSVEQALKWFFQHVLRNSNRRQMATANILFLANDVQNFRMVPYRMFTGDDSRFAYIFGVYEGIVISYIPDFENAPYWEIQWPEIGNNNSQITVYHDEDLIEFCIDADPTGLITLENIETRIEQHISRFENLDDFELFVLPKNMNA